MCSSAGCRCLIGTLGVFDPECGHQCGVCVVLKTHAFVLRMHVAQLNLLASRRSTSRLLSLVRSDDLLHPLADMFVGTLGSAMQKYSLRLQRQSLKLIFLGVPYGFRPVFLQLDRKWTRPYRTVQDCLDEVLDFVAPSGLDLVLDLR